MTEYMDRMPTMHEYAEGKRMKHKPTDLISRADAIERIANDNVVGGMKRINEYRESTEHNDYLDGISTAIATVDDLPSAELPKGDLISRADVLKFPIRLNHYDEVNGSREFVYGVETVIEYIESLPSADAVDCTDFIEWLVDRVLDETIWENNSVAYGEIICRKLAKLGVLEVTEEPSYYIRPSADADRPTGEWIPCEERLPEEPFGCLVTVEDSGFDGSGFCDFNNILPYFVGWDGEQWNDEDGEQCPFEVIAWMPLPEPYKGGDDE